LTVAQAQGSPPSLQGALAAGACIGTLAGLAISLLEPLCALRAAGIAPEAGVSAPLLAASVVLLLPPFVMAGMGVGALLLLLRRASRRACRAGAILAAAACAAGLNAYARALPQGPLGTRTGLLLAALAAAAAGLGYVACRPLAARIARRPFRTLSAVPLGLGLVVWGVALVAANRCGRPRDLPHSVHPSAAGRPNIILVVLDVFRADHMSCYGYGRGTTPNVDALGADARLYENVLSPGYWTLPVHASLFTGLPVSAHGCTAANLFLDAGFDTLAELLGDAGYQTVGLSSNRVLSATRGFGQGFDVYWTPHPPDARMATAAGKLSARLGLWLEPPLAEAMHGRLGEWLVRRYDPAAPFFLFLNYVEAHCPYEPPADRLQWTTPEVAARWKAVNQEKRLYEHAFGVNRLSAGEMAELTALYDGELAYVDAKLGELLHFLKANGLYDNTLIIVTSDHGEQFGEHGLALHGFSLYEPLVRVPLIVRWPAHFPVGREPELVQNHDVFPTILEAAGVAWEPGPAQNCRSLTGLQPGSRRTAISEFGAPFDTVVLGFMEDYPTRDFGRFTRRMRAVQSGNLKLIRSSNGQCELYDLLSDPLETVDISRDRPEAVRRLSMELKGWVSSFPHWEGTAKAPYTDEEDARRDLEALRALGYVQ
jgi:arylsulfatase A-like enzyme